MTDTFNSKFCGAIQKLNSLNYLQWSSSMTQHFASTEIHDIVQGQRKCPTASNTGKGSSASSKENEISTWKRDDSRAKGALLGACTPAMRAHIESAETSAEMWTILSKCANSADTIKGRQNLASKFRTIKTNTGEPLSDYFGRLTEIRDLLKGTDHEIVDWVFRDQLLQNLPEAYANIKDIIENKDPSPSIHDVMETLKAKEIDLSKSIKSANTSSTTETALHSTHYPSQGRGRYRGRGRGTFRSTPYSQTSNCYTCGRPGHRSAQCPQNTTRMTCFNCGEAHRTTDCPHEKLTLEQARKGRSAYSAYLDQKNTARANLLVAEESETTPANSETPL